MARTFFKVAGLLLTIASLVVGVILGIRAGFMADSVWTGVTVSGAIGLGVIMFAFGISRFDQSGYDNKIAKVLYAVSLLGMALLGISLSTMMVSDTVALLSVDPAITEWGLKIGGALFVAPILLVATYYAGKSLILYIDKHRVFSVITLAIAVLIVVARYLITGNFGDAFGTAFGFLFYWMAICFFINVWKNVEYEENSRYWRIGFALAIGVLGCGLLYVFSEVFVQVSVLHDVLLWISFNVGQVFMYGTFGYVALVVSVVILSSVWRKLVYWAR